MWPFKRKKEDWELAEEAETDSRVTEVHRPDGSVGLDIQSLDDNQEFHLTVGGKPVDGLVHFEFGMEPERHFAFVLKAMSPAERAVRDAIKNHPELKISVSYEHAPESVKKHFRGVDIPQLSAGYLYEMVPRNAGVSSIKSAFSIREDAPTPPEWGPKNFMRRQGHSGNAPEPTEPMSTKSANNNDEWWNQP